MAARKIGLALAGGGPGGAVYEIGALRALEEAIEAAKSETFRQKMSLLPKISAFGRLEENAHDLNDTSGNY